MKKDTLFLPSSKFLGFCWAILVVTWLSSCDSTDSKQSLVMVKPAYEEEKNVVVTTMATKGEFFKEYENNGSLQARQKAKMVFKEAGNIEKVLVKNGQKVKKGQLMAKVENRQQQYNYDRSLRNLEKARLELATLLIEQGYRLADSSRVPKEVWDRAMVKSGLFDAQNDSELAAIKLTDTRLIAPFSGVVADLEAKANNETSQYKDFCLLVDNKIFEVEFLVLESELNDMQVGIEVEISPFAIDNLKVLGQIVSVNPKVEENGMVKVKAAVRNNSGHFSEGMNVKILIRKLLGKRVYVPKEAVTLRQERDVVFTHKKDTAYWHYVNIGPSNSKYTVIEQGIKAGDEVIIEGNFNLAHLAVVDVIEQKETKE